MQRVAHPVPRCFIRNGNVGLEGAVACITLEESGSIKQGAVKLPIGSSRPGGMPRTLGASSIRCNFCPACNLKG
jgi:hypothetical protein